jgi:hypothetical protein
MAAKPTCSSADPKAWIKRTLPPERPAASRPFFRVSPSALSKVVGPRVVILRPTSGDRPSKYLQQTQHELPPLGAILRADLEEGVEVKGESFRTRSGLARSPRPIPAGREPCDRSPPATDDSDWCSPSSRGSGLVRWLSDDAKQTKGRTTSQRDQRARARQADPEFSSRKAVAFFLTSSTGRRWPLLG